MLVFVLLYILDFMFVYFDDATNFTWFALVNSTEAAVGAPPRERQGAVLRGNELRASSFVATKLWRWGTEKHGRPLPFFFFFFPK